MNKIGLVVGLVIVGVVIMLLGNGMKPVRQEFSKVDTNNQWSEDEINVYVDSVNCLLTKLSPKHSLLYSKGDYKFQVFKYTFQGKPILYIEKGSSGALGKVEKRYYIKNNHLALYSESSSSQNISKPYVATKAYFNHGRMMYAQQKSALSGSGLNSVKYIKTQLGDKNQLGDIEMFENALQQRGPFNLVFEGITEYPKAKYIILGQKGINSFRAPIRVENEDEFIQELSTNADQYRGEKLHIDWHTGDTNEVVYQSGYLSKN